MESPHAWNTTLSSLIGTGERALDHWTLTLAGMAVHLLPQHWLGMVNPEVVSGEVPVEGDSPDLPLSQLGWSQPLPQPLTNWCLHVVPPQSTTLVGPTSGPHLLWHCILGSLLLARVPSLQQGSPDTSAWWD